MGALPTVLSSVITLIVYALLFAVVVKLFQIATDLGEIKDLIKEIKRNSDDSTPVRPSHAYSPEDLLGALAAESYPESSTTEPEPSR